jgi:hypothetical protein
MASANTLATTHRIDLTGHGLIRPTHQQLSEY